MSKITYTGRMHCIKIGTRYLEPGDVVTSGKPGKGELGTDAVSLERLAARSDFESADRVPSRKPDTPTEVKSDG